MIIENCIDKDLFLFYFWPNFIFSGFAVKNFFLVSRRTLSYNLFFKPYSFESVYFTGEDTLMVYFTIVEMRYADFHWLLVGKEPQNFLSLSVLQLQLGGSIGNRHRLKYVPLL